MTAHEQERPIGDLTPLIDIAFLILIFFMCLPFRTLDGKLESHLPQRGPGPVYEPRAEELVIQVHVLGRADEPRRWGDGTTVRAPTRALYRFSDGYTVDDTDKLFARIRRMKRQATAIGGVAVRGEVKAGPRVQHKYVIAVLNRFAEARITNVDFYGTKLPTRRALLARHLPYPKDD